MKSLTRYDGVSATNRPGQICCYQLPGLTGHHAHHQTQHQRLLWHKQILCGVSFPELNLLSPIAFVVVHVDHALIACYGGHHLPGEEDGPQGLHDRPEDEGDTNADRPGSHWGSPGVGGVIGAHSEGEDEAREESSQEVVKGETLLKDEGELEQIVQRVSEAQVHDRSELDKN